MKKLLLLFIIQHLAFNIFAQSGTMLHDGFILPNLAVEPACTATDVGKMYYNTTSNAIKVCNGTDWQTTSQLWGNGGSPGTISASEVVGIGTQDPQYRLDVNGTARISSYLLAQGISIGSPGNSALTVTDGDIAMTSTADAKTWKFDYSDEGNNLSLKEDGTARMVFANGGNVGIGSAIPTEKLSVGGSGSFTGNLTVNGGKGIVRTSSVTSLKTHIAQKNLGTTFSVPNTGSACSTSTVDITAAGFTVAPTAQVGNLVSGTGDFGKLVINVQSTTTTSVVIRFCNNTTTSTITLSNMIFNVMCIGQ